MSFEEAKQYLRREDQDGHSLYEHLSRVLLKVIVEKPHNANSMFEQLSHELRGNAREKTPMIGNEPHLINANNLQLEWCKAASSLYDPAESEGSDISYPDLMTEARVYEWAGVSLGHTETYLLYLSIKKKATIEARTLRFWGKILGRSADYYVIQGENPEPPTVEMISTIEGVEGANKYAFWVCNHVGGGWSKLPNVSPEAIMVSRRIKRFMTGDLNAPVPSYPPFPGVSEAHLLRAQIAQITSECSISPTGLYMEDDDADEGIKAIKRVEEIDEYKSADELKDVTSWVHHEVPINLNGRCNQPPANEEEDENAEAGSELPDLPLLGSIGEEEFEDGPSWAINSCPGGAGESPDSTVCAKSLKWPGAFAAAFGNKFTNVYCGFGCASARGIPYEPPIAPRIQKEWSPSEDEDKGGIIEDDDKITQPVLEEDEDEEA